MTFLPIVITSKLFLEHDPRFRGVLARTSLFPNGATIDHALMA